MSLHRRSAAALASGIGGAVFSTVMPYTALRPDVYDPFHDAFDETTSVIPRANPVAPFHLCYPASALGTTRQGYDVAGIDLMLDGGWSWTLHGGSSLVLVNDQTACFALVPMTTSMPAAADSPAVIVGGFEMGNRLIMFDLGLAKETFAFSGLLSGMGTSCSNLYFTMRTS
jgi:hypothetical protein